MKCQYTSSCQPGYIEIPALESGYLLVSWGGLIGNNYVVSLQNPAVGRRAPLLRQVCLRVRGQQGTINLLQSSSFLHSTTFRNIYSSPSPSDSPLCACGISVNQCSYSFWHQYCRWILRGRQVWSLRGVDFHFLIDPPFAFWLRAIRPGGGRPASKSVPENLLQS